MLTISWTQPEARNNEAMDAYRSVSHGQENGGENGRVNLKNPTEYV